MERPDPDFPDASWNPNLLEPGPGETVQLDLLQALRELDRAQLSAVLKHAVGQRFQRRWQFYALKPALGEDAGAERFQTLLQGDVSQVLAVGERRFPDFSEALRKRDLREPGP